MASPPGSSRARRPWIAAFALACASPVTAWGISGSPPEASAAAGPATTSTDLAVGTASTSYRIPALTVTGENTVLAAYDQRNGQSSDLPGDIDVVVRRSTDSGATWSEPSTVVDHPGPQGCGDSSLTTDRSTGRVFLFCTYSAGNVGFPDSKPGTSDPDDPNTLHVRVTHSDDDGVSWSEPADLNRQVKEPSWQAVFTSSGHGIQTSKGRLIQPIVVKDGNGGVHSANIYSDDHGKSWKHGALLAEGTDESKPVELADGRVVQNSRPGSGTTRLMSTSTDGGHSFGAPSPAEELIDPRVNGDQIRVASSNSAAKKNWMLFSNPASTSARTDLTLRLSCDSGTSWPVDHRLHTGPSGYSALTMLPDGRIGIFAEIGERDAGEKLTFTALAFDELGQGC